MKYDIYLLELVTSKIIFVPVIVMAFIAGTITSSALVSADTNDTRNPFEPLQKQFDSLRAAMTGQSCTSGKVVGGIDSDGHIICVSVTKGNTKILQSPILFQNYGVTFGSTHPSTGHALVIPLAGVVDNLVVSCDFCPGVGQSAIITILKNDSVTPMTCVLEEKSTSCTDTTHSFSVNRGDILNEKFTPSGSGVSLELQISAVLTH